MRTTKFNESPIIARQRGVAMIIALIILVAMSLAGIGLMRSVDTGSMIAGNMAFRQSTLNATDAGTGMAFAALMAVANSGNAADKAILNYDGNNTQPCTGAPGANPVVDGTAVCAGTNIKFPGYYSAPLAACEVTGTGCTATQTSWWTDSTKWANAYTLTSTEYPDTSTTVQYLIHRMCQTSNAAPSTAGNACQYYSPSCTSCTNGVISVPVPPSPIYYYRISVRVTGPRNTYSYSQTYVQSM